MSRLQRLVLGSSAVALLALLVWQNPDLVRVHIAGSSGLQLPLAVTLLTAAVLGGVASWGFTASRRRPRGHDPKALLPLVLSKNVRKALNRAYEVGAMDEAAATVGKELEKHPNNLGLHYWWIRLQIDMGRSEDARAALVDLLPRLPETALTVRWSSLYEAAGERDLWIRNVLERIRAGQLVRRSTFRELARMLEAAQQFEAGLEVLQRLRELDPPTPDEEEELTHTEMILRMRLAQVLVEEGKSDEALAHVGAVREQYTGWRSPYRIGHRAALAQDDETEAVDWLLEGFRNTGDADLLMLAYEHQAAEVNPVSLLERWDDHLTDLTSDGWYLLTTGWIALRHGLIEEGVGRLNRVDVEDEAWTHAQIVLAAFDGRRGHMRSAAEAALAATWAWAELPYVWQCGVCNKVDRHAPFICPQCRSWESYRMQRPLAPEAEAPAALSG